MILRSVAFALSISTIPNLPNVETRKEIERPQFNRIKLSSVFVRRLGAAFSSPPAAAAASSSSSGSQEATNEGWPMMDSL
jgi:hypothetical protein